MISYYGGKQRIASWICQYIPPHTVYVEPFCGGAAVFFKKGAAPVTNQDYYREVLNDSNKQLITMFRVLQSNPELERRLRYTLYSSEEHIKAKQIYKDVENGVEHEHKDIDIAWAFFVNVHMGFANKPNGGFGRGVITANHPSSWFKKTNVIGLIRERLSNAYIECEDALSVIDRWDSPQTFFYCDPPYLGTFIDPYRDYTFEDYQNLLKKLDSIKGSFLLSCYAQGVEPSHWTIIQKDTYCSASWKGKVGSNRAKKVPKEELGDRKRTESLFFMPRQVDVRPSLRKHMWCPCNGFDGEVETLDLDFS